MNQRPQIDLKILLTIVGLAQVPALAIGGCQYQQSIKIAEQNARVEERLVSMDWRLRRLEEVKKADGKQE